MSGHGVRTRCETRTVCRAAVAVACPDAGVSPSVVRRAVLSGAVAVLGDTCQMTGNGGGLSGSWVSA